MISWISNMQLLMFCTGPGSHESTIGATLHGPVKLLAIIVENDHHWLSLSQSTHTSSKRWFDSEPCVLTTHSLRLGHKILGRMSHEIPVCLWYQSYRCPDQVDRWILLSKPTSHQRPVFRADVSALCIPFLVIIKVEDRVRRHHEFIADITKGFLACSTANFESFNKFWLFSWCWVHNHYGFSSPHNSCEPHPFLSNLHLIHSKRSISRVTKFHHNHHTRGSAAFDIRSLQLRMCCAMSVNTFSATLDKQTRRTEITFW